jgi:L-proline amide hydrolase
MKPYEALADERRVVFYDQLGAGNSAVEEPHDPAMWRPELFVEEVGVVREALGLDRVHVLGHSWGGMLGMQYAATQPDGLVSLIVESSPPSVPAWMGELAKLRAELPPEVEATLRRHEEADTTNSEEYQQAEMEFYKRHLCRVDPWPDWLNESFSIMLANPEVYNTMNGPSEFHVIGSLLTWSVIDRLPQLRVPTLVVAGAHDEAQPETWQPFVDLLPDVRSHVFPDSSHMPHVEEPQAFLDVVANFLRAHD